MTGTIEVDGKPVPFTIDDGATQADLDELEQHLTGGAAPTTSTGTEAPAPDPDAGTTWYGRAGDYALNRGLDWLNALQRVTTPPSDLGQTASDALTVAGPVVAPLPTAVGVAAGAATRAVGGTPGEATAADIAGNILTGGAQAAKAIYEAGGLGKSVEAVKDLLGAKAPVDVGRTIQAEFPAVEEGIRTGVQGATYDAAKAEMAARGAAINPPQIITSKYGAALGVSPQPTALDPIGQTLLDRLQAAKAKWGAISPNAETSAADELIGRLTTPGGAPITYADLDQQYLNLQKTGYGTASSVRAAIDDAMNSLAEGTPAAELRAAGKARWGAEVAPAKELAKDVTKSTAGVQDPVGLFNKIGGSHLRNPAKAIAFRDAAGEKSDLWRDVVGGFYGHLFESAGNDAKAAVSKWNKLPQVVKDVYDPTGAAEKAFQRLAVTVRGDPAAKVARFAIAAGMGVEAGKAFYDGDPKLGMEYLIGAGLGEATHLTGAIGRAVGALGPGAAPLGRSLVSATTPLLGGGGSAPPASESSPSGETPETPPSTTSTTTSTTLPAASQRDSRPYASEFATAAQIAGIPVDLMHAIADQETKGRDPSAVSHAGAVGVMQIMPEQFKKYSGEVAAITGHDPDIYDPVDNIVAGALHLRDDLKASRTGSFGAALRYIGGPDPRLWGPTSIGYARRVAAALGQPGPGG